MVVIPEGAQRFVDVAGTWMSREYAGVLHWIVLVVPKQRAGVLGGEKVAGKTVAFRGSMTVVEVPGYRG